MIGYHVGHDDLLQAAQGENLKLLLKGKNARQIMAECGVSRRHVVWLRRRAESEGLALPPVKPHTNSRPLA